MRGQQTTTALLLLLLLHLCSFLLAGVVAAAAATAGEHTVGLSIYPYVAEYESVDCSTSVYEVSAFCIIRRWFPHAPLHVWCVGREQAAAGAGSPADRAAEQSAQDRGGGQEGAEAVQGGAR